MAKRKTIKDDPFASREAERYDNPIPSREYILDYLTKREQPLSREMLR